MNEIINARSRALAGDKAMTTMTTANRNRSVHSTVHTGLPFNGCFMPCRNIKKILDVNPIILCLAFVRSPRSSCTQ